MKELSDDELQQWLEQQLKEDKNPDLTTDAEDAALYRVLFTALADEPYIATNNKLADNVVKQIQTANQESELWRYYLVIAGVLACGAMAAYFAVNYINPYMLKPLLGFANAYKWIVAFIILCLCIIETADKVLVKRKLSIGS